MDITTLSPTQIKNWCRASMGEVPFPGDDAYPEYSIVSTKKDGWFAALAIHDGKMDVISSAGAICRTVPVDVSGQYLLVAEWMIGTPRAMNPAENGKFYVHDIAISQGVDVTALSYPERWEQAACLLRSGSLPSTMEMLPWYERGFTTTLWESTPDEEGLVLKQPLGFGNQLKGLKVKRVFEKDFVCISIGEGGGRLKGSMGAITGRDGAGGTSSVGGGFSDTLRREIWEHRAEYIGKVFTAKGNVYGGGNSSLRHPQFLRWREDKLPEDVR